MIVFRHPVRVVLLGVMLALIAGVAPAYAASTIIDVPDAAYVSSTTRIDFSAVAEGSIVGQVSDAEQTITFSGNLRKFTTPNAFEPYDWGYVPFVESTSNVPYVTGYGPVEMTLSAPASTFGMEIYNGRTGPADITVTFLSETSEVIGTVQRYVSWDGSNWDARLFAVTSDTPIASVSIVTSNNGSVGYGQFRYAVATETPVVSTPASSPWSLALIAVLGLVALPMIRRVKVRG